MLTLNDGRKELYQWDTGRIATVDVECEVVHFSNLKYGESLAVEVKDGEVAIPNKLLMSGAQIYCWAFANDDSGTYTKNEQTLVVIKRPKPSDYVYTETEVLTVETAVNNALEKAKESGEFKGDKGDKGDTGDRGEQGIQGEKGDQGERGEQGIQGEKGDTGDRGEQGIQGEKGDQGERGEQGIQGEKGDKGDKGEQGIQGLKGDKGDKGADGYTPQKGVDYFTDEDIAGLNIPSVDQIYNPDSENAQSGRAIAEELGKIVERSDSKTNALEKRVTNLEQGLPDDESYTDATVAYTKDVPSNALPYAEVKKIGGMTRKCTNLIPNPMLNEGSTALPYEPYFEGLRDAKVTEMKSVGANLFDIEKRLYGTIDSNGDLKLLSGVHPFYRYNFKANTRYTLSCYIKNADGAGKVRFEVMYTDGTSDDGVLLNHNTEWKYKSFTTDEGKTVDYIGTTHGTTGIAFVKGGELMINEGTEALPYTPYMESTLPIPEAVQALDGYGLGINADCYNYVDWEKKQFVKRVEKVVFDGTENWGSETSNVLGKVAFSFILAKRALTHTNGIGDVGLGLCNVYDFNSMGGDVANTFRFSTDNGLKAWFHPTEYNTIDEWKAYLSELHSSGNPLTIVYAITPEVTDISDLLPEDNFIEVEGNGSITAVNEYEYDVPSEIEYQLEV